MCWTFDVFMSGASDWEKEVGDAGLCGRGCSAGVYVGMEAT